MIQPKKLKFSKLLGKGSFGSVYEVQISKKEKVAVKLVRPKENNYGLPSIFEIDCYSRLSHPGLISSIGLQEHQNSIAIKMPIAVQCLQNIESNENISITSRIHYMYILCSALSHLHFNRIVHHDIKSTNILMLNDIPKISDFGESLLFSDETTRKRGTKSYWAPELFDSSEKSYIRFESDIWSLGIVFLYLMSYGKKLFTTEYSIEHQIKYLFDKSRYRITIERYCDRIPLSFSSKCIDFLSHFLCPLSERWNIDEILNHELFNTFSKIYGIDLCFSYVQCCSLEFITYSSRELLEICKDKYPTYPLIFLYTAFDIMYRFLSIEFSNDLPNLFSTCCTLSMKYHQCRLEDISLNEEEKKREIRVVLRLNGIIYENRLYRSCVDIDDCVKKSHILLSPSKYMNLIIEDGFGPTKKINVIEWCSMLV